MTGPAYHGWTHRPKAQGGTDPIPVESGSLKWCHAFAGAQSITPSSGDYFFTWNHLYASDSDTFEVSDVTAGRGDWIQINTPGYYIWKVRAGGGSVWDNGFYTKITTMFNMTGVGAADFVVNSGDADWGGDEFNSSSEMFSGETAHKVLYEENAFNWDPANPQSDMDDENPLKVSMRVETVGATTAKTLQAEMLIVRIADAGYVDLSPT
jgi:hypothetical protein